MWSSMASYIRRSVPRESRQWNATWEIRGVRREVFAGILDDDQESVHELLLESGLLQNAFDVPNATSSDGGPARSHARASSDA